MLRGINPVIYELLNLAIMTLCLFVVAIFARYLYAETLPSRGINGEVIPPRIIIRRWRPFGGWLRHQMAVAFVVSAGGEAMLRSWTWGIRFFDRIGYDVEAFRFFPYTAFPILAAIVQCLGLLCLIRVVTPDDWGQWTWVVCSLIVGALVFATGVLH